MARKKINVLDLAGTLRKGVRTIGAGTPAGALRAVADAAATPHIDRLARRYVERQKQKAGPVAKSEKKLTGISFWLIVGLGIVKDSLDIFLNLTLILVLFVIPIGFLISFGVFVYFYFQGVKMDSRKIATLVIGFLLDVMPLLSIFPTFTITLFIIRWLENSKDKKIFRFSVSKIAQAEV